MVVKEKIDLAADSINIYNYYKTGILRVYRIGEWDGENYEKILEAEVTVKGERFKHYNGNITLDIISIASDESQPFNQTIDFKIKPVDVDADNGSF
jgi:hypothetical protein